MTAKYTSSTFLRKRKYGMTGSRDKEQVYDPQNESLPSTPADSEVVTGQE